MFKKTSSPISVGCIFALIPIVVVILVVIVITLSGPGGAGAGDLVEFLNSSVIFVAIAAFIVGYLWQSKR